MDNPRVVSQEQWLAARKALLAREKEATHAKDAVDAARRVPNGGSLRWMRIGHWLHDVAVVSSA